MNLTSIRKQSLPAAAGGILLFLLRAALYRTGFDDRGLLAPFHPLQLASAVLCAAMVVWLFLASRQEPESRPMVRYLAGLVGGYLMLLHGLSLVDQADSFLNLLRCALAFASAAAMAVCVFPFHRQHWPRSFCLGVISCHYALDMLCRYRVWSGNPQLPDYCFHVLCAVALSLGTYQALALQNDMAKPRLHRFFCLSALFLCPGCLIGPDPWQFYLSGTFWAVACMQITPPDPEELPEEESDVSA